MAINKISFDRTALPARDRVLQTAHSLFYQEGIRATGIDRIIAESRVTKVTFYRHFPSKNELIKAVLEHRHELWMTWFINALNRPGRCGLDALMLALEEWFRDEGYRGCAFINAVVEIGGVLPGAIEISRQHKQDVVQAISKLLPASAHRVRDAEAVAMAMDGAIIRAQMDGSPDAALRVLATLLHSIRMNTNREIHCIVP